MTALDIGGVTFPGLPGQGVDHLMARWAARVADAAITLWQEDPQDPISGPCLRAIEAVPRSALPSVFDHPLATFDAAIAPSNDLPDTRSPAARRTALARHLFGAPDLPDFTLVLTGAEAPDALMLPKIGVCLKPPGDRVVSICHKDGRVQIIRDDGLSATFRIGVRAPEGIEHPMFASIPRVGPFDILNAEPSVADAIARFELASGSTLRAAMSRLADGHAYLTEIWPLAADAMTRHVRGLVLLEPRSYERSHSPVGLCGTIVMTAGAPVTIGDLLCHEASHIRMHVLKALDDVITAQNPDDEAEGFDSPWRPDKRPIDGLTLGVHAFLNVCAWYARVAERGSGPDGAFARRIHERQATNVRLGWALLREKGRVTDTGSALAKEFATAVDALPVLLDHGATHG